MLPHQVHKSSEFLQPQLNECEYAVFLGKKLKLYVKLGLIYTLSLKCWSDLNEARST